MGRPAPLPDIRQRNAHECATAAWRCVYHFHHGRDARVLNLAHPINGTDPAVLEAVIRQDAAWYVRSGETMLDDLRHYVSLWRPPICLITYPEDTDSHYVTVGGVWRNHVYFQCPEKGWQKMKTDLFQQCWRGLGKYRDFEFWSITAWPAL